MKNRIIKDRFFSLSSPSLLACFSFLLFSALPLSSQQGASGDDYYYDDSYYGDAYYGDDYGDGGDYGGSYYGDEGGQPAEEAPSAAAEAPPATEEAVPPKTEDVIATEEVVTPEETVTAKEVAKTEEPATGGEIAEESLTKETEGASLGAEDTSPEVSENTYEKKLSQKDSGCVVLFPASIGYCEEIETDGRSVSYRVVNVDVSSSRTQTEEKLYLVGAGRQNFVSFGTLFDTASNGGELVPGDFLMTGRRLIRGNEGEESFFLSFVFAIPAELTLQSVSFGSEYEDQPIKEKPSLYYRSSGKVRFYVLEKRYTRLSDAQEEFSRGKAISLGFSNASPVDLFLSETHPMSLFSVIQQNSDRLLPN